MSQLCLHTLIKTHLLTNGRVYTILLLFYKWWYLINDDKAKFLWTWQTFLFRAKRKLINNDECKQSKTVYNNNYRARERYRVKLLTGSGGPTKSLKAMGTSPWLLISIAKHEPQQSSSTILWNESNSYENSLRLIKINKENNLVFNNYVLLSQWES